MVMIEEKLNKNKQSKKKKKDTFAVDKLKFGSYDNDF